MNITTEEFNKKVVHDVMEMSLEMFQRHGIRHVSAVADEYVLKHGNEQRMNYDKEIEFITMRLLQHYNPMQQIDAKM